MELNEFTNLVSNLKTYDQILSVIEQYDLPLIGQGTYRNVYELNKQQVVKLDNNQHGETSNKNEVETYSCLGKEYAAQIISWDKNNYVWIVVEQIRKNGDLYSIENKLKELIPTIVIKLNQLVDCFTGQNKNLHSNLYQTNQWYKNFYDRIVKCNVSAIDLNKAAQWGIRQGTDELVLIDYGYARNQSENYASLSEFIFKK